MLKTTTDSRPEIMSDFGYYNYARFLPAGSSNIVFKHLRDL